MIPGNSPYSKYKRGVITMAVGKPEFVEMAVDMALSYKEFNTEPVSCIVDNQTKDIIEEKYSAIFEHLLFLPENYSSGRLRKFSCAELSPYESTVFIDSDILFLKDIFNLWQQGELNNNVTMIGDYLEKNTPIKHHGFSISEIIKTCAISRYMKTNSGFFHFMRTSSKPFFKACEKKYSELQLNTSLSAKGWLGDEIAIGIVGYKYNVSCFKTPSPMMWDQQLASLKKNDNTYPICHFIAPIPKSTVKWLVNRAKNLRKLNGIPTGGEKIWTRLNNQRLMSRKPTLGFRIKNKLKSYISV